MKFCRTPILTTILALLLLFPLHANAQNSNVRADYQARANQLVELLNGSQQEADFFAQSFLDAVPVPTFRKIRDQLNTQYGAAESIAGIVRQTALIGTVEVRYEKAIVAIQLVIAAEADHQVIGLRITGAKTHGDSLAAIQAEFKKLDGVAGFTVARIDTAEPSIVGGLNSEHHFSIGSTFKLYVLAELTRAIAAGERQWSDVVPLSHKSLPSGISQNWPQKTPMTLQTLATLMISISDNSATDTLIHALGRDAIGKQIISVGHSEPGKMLPLLTTLEAFALKMPKAKALRGEFMAASDSRQKRILTEKAQQLEVKDVDVSQLAGNPLFVGEIEWIASHKDIVALLAWLNNQSDQTFRDILSINKGIAPGDALRWQSLGYKGGSEPGVMNMSFLAVAKNGQTYAISGSWNNPDQPINQVTFAALMSRLLNHFAK